MKVTEDYDLTYAELISILAGQINSWTVSQVRSERLADKEKGDQAEEGMRVQKSKNCDCQASYSSYLQYSESAARCSVCHRLKL